MMDYHMRMLSHHHRLMRELLTDTTREHACFLVCQIAQGVDATNFLVQEVLPLNTTDLLVHALDQLSVAPQAMLRVARYAQSRGASICMVHTHPMSIGSVEFSCADDLGNQRTFDFFTRMLPHQPNACLVWGYHLECVAGRVYFSGSAWRSIDLVTVCDDENRRVISRGPDGAGTNRVPEVFTRQACILGVEGQRILQSLHIGVIGCGGIGSLAATVLAHSGVGQLTLVDFDVSSPSNRPRIIGMAPEDGQRQTKKVALLSRYIAHCFPECKVVTLDCPVERDRIMKHLVELDAVVCATDDTTSRAFLNQLCHQYYVPMLDLGVQFTADKATGYLVKEIGRASFVLPGTTCLCCSGHIDPEVLRLESLPQATRQGLVRDGYIQNANVTEPSMMMFNMQVAARGLQILLGWFSGLQAVVRDEYDRFNFLGLLGQQGIKAVKKHQQIDCLFCGKHAPLLGAGDAAVLLVRERPVTAGLL
jgi:molybdopterin-synthase adenylyltransferase